MNVDLKYKVLLAEDDLDLGNMLRQYLELFEFQVHRVTDGEQAVQALEGQTFDIAVLDVMMPKMDGFATAKAIKKRCPQLPFLFLTAKVLKEDRIKGLQLGADDYILKPFEADELVLRLKNILQRSAKVASKIPAEDPILKIGIFQFDPVNLTLISPSLTHKLTKKESQLLHFLIKHKNQLVKREAILDELWSETDFFSGRSMDVFVSKLRRYLKEDNSVSIETIRGLGLRLNLNK